MILKSQDRVLVAHRRLFKGDDTRYFIGFVDAYGDGVARVTGYTWVRDSASGDFFRKDDERTKLVAIAAGTVIVYQLPESVDMGALTMKFEPNGLFLEDGDDFRMNLSESTRSSHSDAA